MIRFLSLTALLLAACLPSIAQITTTPQNADRCYTIRTEGRGTLVYSKKHGTIRAQHPDNSSTAARFAFIPFETADGIRHTYIYNIDSKSFLLHDKRDYPNLVNKYNNPVRLGKKNLRNYLVDVRVTTRHKQDRASLVTGEGYTLNCNESGLVTVNQWNYADHGNRLTITDAGLFATEDYIEALNMLGAELEEQTSGWQAVP